MGMPPQQVQYLSSLIKFTWCIKILFGYIIDRFNHNYKGWMITSSVIGLIGFSLCYFQSTISFIISGLILVNLSMTLSDIVVDASMIILFHQTDLEPKEVQPYAWMSLYVGVFLGYSIGGFVYDYKYFYLIWMCAPLLTFLCAFFLPIYKDKAHTFSFKYNNVIFNKRTGVLLLFIIISRSAPSYSIGLDLYRKDIGILVSRIAWSKAAGAVLAMFSSFLFKFSLSKTNTIVQLVVIQLLHVLLCVLDGLSIDIHSIHFMVSIDCLEQVCTAIYMLIIMIYAMSICPNGYEAFYISMIMTAYNLGNEIGEIQGGIVFSYLDIDNSFDNLSYAIILKGIWTALSCIILIVF